MFDVVYVISNNGLPLFIYEFDELQENPESKNMLFAGVMVGIIKLLLEVDEGEVEFIVTNNSIIHISSIGEYTIVCINKRNTGIPQSNTKLLMDMLLIETQLLTLDHDPISIISPDLHNRFTSSFTRIVNQWKSEIAIV